MNMKIKINLTEPEASWIQAALKSEIYQAKEIIAGNEVSGTLENLLKLKIDNLTDLINRIENAKEKEIKKIRKSQGC